MKINDIKKWKKLDDALMETTTKPRSFQFLIYNVSEKRFIGICSLIKAHKLPNVSVEYKPAWETRMNTLLINAGQFGVYGYMTKDALMAILENHTINGQAKFWVDGDNCDGMQITIDSDLNIIKTFECHLG